MQLFVNTADREHGREWLGTPEELREWIAGAGLGPVAHVGEAELRLARELREALRALAEANAGAPVSAEAVGVVNHFARASGLSVGLDETATVRFDGAAASFDGVVCRLLGVVFEAMVDGSWQRLKACPQCRWAFYDYSRNRSASWCSMQLCGGRAKARAYRARRAGSKA